MNNYHAFFVIVYVFCMRSFELYIMRGSSSKILVKVTCCLRIKINCVPTSFNSYNMNRAVTLRSMPSASDAISESSSAEKSEFVGFGKVLTAFLRLLAPECMFYQNNLIFLRWSNNFQWQLRSLIGTSN